MAIISRVEPTAPALRKRERVAAYARVSVESEKMNHSLSAQISYYSSLIQKNPEWEYAGVYADDFVSGTGTAKRDEFNRMLADCEAGKIDIVLVKSISRFARNTVDLLETVRHLKDIGVEVRFEREHISSFSGDGELMLTILASFAQEESRSISENIKWSIQKKYEKGQSHAARRCLGYRWENGHYAIVPEEAEIVRLIFSLYLQGRNCVQIADELESRNIIGINGGRMGPCYIIEVLDNITYQGDMRFQREYSPNVGQSKRNYGEAPKFVLVDAHEPIICRSDFEKVKQLRDQDRNIKGRRRTTCFSRKIFCSACGAMMYRRTFRQSGDKIKYWKCSKAVISHGEDCNAKYIRESDLEKMAAYVFGSFDSELFDEKVEKCMVSDSDVQVIKYDGEVKIWQR